MGRLLARSAFSPNITERLDFSCALFGARGELLAQAAHIPVHLGSLPDLLAAIHAKEQRPGHCWIANSPYHGGTHLPDLTLVKPIFEEKTLAGYAAARAHHSDVGGMTAGSMPDSQEVFQEGLILPPLLLFKSGKPTELWELLLANVRTPTEREGDLRAQVAACDLGARRFLQLKPDQALVQRLLDSGEAQMAALLEPLGSRQVEAEEVLDWGEQRIPLRVRLSLEDGRATIDLRQAAQALPAPINATRAITCAAAYYPFFCLAQAQQGNVVINAGSLRRLEVITRPGTLLHARPPFPVCAGNVETSQRVCDLVWRALAQLFPQLVPAQSACTMNNLTIGNARLATPFTYYETCGGGHGASAQGPGASGQQIAMTNTRNTPAEILETYYPLRLWSYRLRRGSGGAGRHPGGEGVVRELELLCPAQISLLASRRRLAAAGLAGGKSGEVGLDLANGRVLLPPWSGWLEANTRLVLHTPGGGGWGSAS
ncbi:MAG: hydantoinase B/oxoprolinase family protein [Candidatus Eremiobacteraeota bacterium]|nr:hydantoinase B/oxoprolinase family protein [Candidatus Eremiobacteraeota bacterium]